MRKFLSILLILALTSTAIAADRISIRKLGGLNTKTNAYELQDFEASDMSNFVLDEAGSITERNLFKQYNISSIGTTTLDYVFKFYKTSDAGYLICAGGTKLYQATNGTLSDISNVSISVTSGSQWSFETFTDGSNEQVFAANQDAVLQKWAGSSTFGNATASTTTNCNILKRHKARLWAAGSKSVPYRIYYSSLNDGDDWSTSGGSFDLPAYEKIMALEVLGDVLYAFTRTSIYAIVGDTPNEFYVQRTQSKVGTHSYKSVVRGGSLIFFLNKAGVFAFDGSESVNISETIQPTIDAISNTYIGTSAGLYDNRGRYWLSYTSTNGTFNDTILIYDTVVKQWYVLDGAALNSFFKADGGTDKGEIFAGASNPIGYLWQLQTSSSLEQITHSTESQLASGVTFNTVVSADPSVRLLSGRDAFTKLLIHFDGVDGATSYTTEDYALRTVTFSGDAQLDTAQKKIGSASLLLDGTGDYVTVPDDGDWAFGTGDFTIDFWVRLAAKDTDQAFIHQGANSGDENIYARLDSSNKLQMAFYTNAGASVQGSFIMTNAWAPSLNTWYHLAFVRNGSNAYIFIDGVSQSLTTTTAFGTIANQSGALYIGKYSYLSTFVNGWMDEIRISNKARWTSDFTPPTYKYDNPTASGTLTSANLQINAAGQASLGAITWQETIPSNTDIQLTTRTGTTSDMVYYNGWQPWVSTSTVVAAVTNPSVWTAIGTITAQAPTTPQTRDILYYETDDSVSANSVQLGVSGAISTGAYVSSTIPIKDLTNYKFIGYWLKSPTTGNSIKLGLGETSNDEIYTTANTVSINTWEYHYWPLTYTSTAKDAIKNLRVTYLGDGTGSIYLGTVTAYDFLDSGETITSTPNDWIQYRAILGTNDTTTTPELVNANGYVVTLSYSTTSGASETSLTSFWQSKQFDFGQPNYNKFFQWLELTAESQNPTTGNTVYLDYTCDDGVKSGTLAQTFSVTGQTTKLRYYFPSGTYGKNLQFKIRDIDVDDDIKINNATISFILEGNS